MQAIVSQASTVAEDIDLGGVGPSDVPLRRDDAPGDRVVAGSERPRTPTNAAPSGVLTNFCITFSFAMCATSGDTSYGRGEWQK